MRYSELVAGDRFTLPIDCDGFEPVWTLLDATSGTLYGGVTGRESRTTATAEGLQPDTLVDLMGHITLHAEVTDMERVAMTLLHDEPMRPLWIDDMVNALLADPNEMRMSFEFGQQLPDHANHIQTFADATALYRQMGRPDGEYTRGFAGLSGYTITSSLAAAVLEFVAASRGELYIRMERMEAAR